MTLEITAKAMRDTAIEYNGCLPDLLSRINMAIRDSAAKGQYHAYLVFGKDLYGSNVMELNDDDIRASVVEDLRSRGFVVDEHIDNAKWSSEQAILIKWMDE